MTSILLVATHIILLACTLVLPVLLARTAAKRLKQERALIAMGLLAFVAAELLRLVLESLSYRGFETGVLPLPSQEAAPLLRVLLGGFVLALTMEGTRFVFFRRQIPDHRDARGAAVFGAGIAASALALFALLELGIAAAAWVWPESDMLAIENAGLSERMARKLGLAIFAWWERTPTEVLVLCAEKIVFFVFQVALTICVARSAAPKEQGGQKRWWFYAFVVHFAAATASAHTPVYGSLFYGAGTVLCVPVFWRWSRKLAKPAKSAL
ncbi:MAG: hypothetical protein ACI9KE_004567 [Polyangiales bacterium]|jgi:hypothetical protein